MKRPPHPALPEAPAMLDAASATVFATLTGGQFLAACATQLGARGLLFAAVTSLVHLTTALQPLAAPQVQRSDRKRLCIGGSAVARLCWLFVAAAALSLGARTAVLAVALLLVVSNSAAAVSSNAWLTWISELVPSEQRPGFFARRNVLVSLTNMAAVMAGGWYMDWLGKPWGCLHVFGVGVAFGMLSLWALSRHPRPVVAAVAELGAATVSDYLRLPLKDAAFRQILIFKMSWCFVVGLAAPLWLPHMVDVLGMRQSQVSCYNLCGLGATIVFSGLFARLAGVIGNRPTLLLCALGITTNPLWWCFSTRGFLSPCWFEGFWSGAMWSGFNLVILNLAIELAPQRARPIYLALFQASEGLAFLTGGLTGGWLASFTEGFAWHGLGFHLGPYHPIFLLSSAGRAAAIALLVPIVARRAAVALEPDYSCELPKAA